MLNKQPRQQGILRNNGTAMAVLAAPLPAALGLHSKLCSQQLTYYRNCYISMIMQAGNRMIGLLVTT